MQRVIKQVIRRVTHMDGGLRLETPFSVVTFAGCVHEGCSEEPIGTRVECERCGDLAAAILQIREFMASTEYSHVTERSTAANRTRAWTSFLFYRRDPDSPTQCVLAFGAPCCDEIRALIAELGGRAVPGPSRGEMAIR